MGSFGLWHPVSGFLPFGAVFKFACIAACGRGVRSRPVPAHRSVGPWELPVLATVNLLLWVLVHVSSGGWPCGSQCRHTSPRSSLSSNFPERLCAPAAHRPALHRSRSAGGVGCVCVSLLVREGQRPLVCVLAGGVSCSL